MSTKRALLFANESSRSLTKSNQFDRHYSHQYSNINLNRTHKCETASNFVQSDSKNSLKNIQSNGFVDNYKKDKIALNSWKTKDLSKSAFGQQNYLQKDDSKKEWKNKNVEILNNKSSSTLSLHISAYENCSLEESQNEKVLKKSKQINDTFTILPCRQQIEDESKSTETMAFKLSQKLFNPNDMIIRRSKLPEINQIRSYARQVVKTQQQVAASQSSEFTYNVGESDFVKKILNDYPKQVEYLNAILKDTEEKRRGRNHKLINDRKELIKLFQDKLCTSNAKLIPVGSSASGLICDHASDIDLCLYTEDIEFYKDFVRYRSLRNYMFNKMRYLLFELRDVDPELHVVDSFSLLDAHVPIQIFTFKKGLSLDIQVPREDFQAIRNTNLVKHYLLADERLSQIYLFIKKLFEVLGLRNSKGGLLSSYQLMMLTIHFLQCRTMSKPVLPVLCSLIPHRVGPDVPIDTVIKLIDGEFGDFKLDWKSKNTQTPAELIFEMLNYYRNFFNPNYHQIYINRGLAIKRQPNKNVISTSLQLFDPYSPSSICRSPFISDAFATGIRYIYRKMSYGKLFDSFPHFDDAKGFDKYIEDKPWAFKVKCQ